MIIIPWIFEPELETLGLLPSDIRTNRQQMVDFQFPTSISNELNIVLGFLSVLSHSWYCIFHLSRSVSHRRGLDLYDTGFVYPHEFEEWELEKEGYFEEVAVYTPAQTQVQMRLAVFERLMLRVFHTAMESAHRYKDPILHDPRFVQFIKDINQIEQRLEEESKKVA